MSKDCEKPRILRLVGALLATAGLQVHGLAMLLVGLLASPATAQPEALYLDEICTSDGLLRLPDRQRGEPDGRGGHHGDPIETCPVCTASAAWGVLDLPSVSTLSPSDCCGATQRLNQEKATHRAPRLTAQPRAPPTRA